MYTNSSFENTLQHGNKEDITGSGWVCVIGKRLRSNEGNQNDFSTIRGVFRYFGELERYFQIIKHHLYTLGRKIRI